VGKQPTKSQKMENDQEKNNEAADEHEASELAAAQVRREKKMADECHAYDLAILAAQACPGFQDPHKAIEKAWALLKASELHLRGIDLEALANSPRAEAEWREQEEKRLAGLRLTYDDLKRVVTGHLKHYDRAELWFNRFLNAKAKKEGKSEAWVEALKLTYRNKTFTGTEAKKLQEEYRQWRGYRGQGRVTRKGDLRLRENKEKKLEKAQKATGSQTRRTKPKLEFTGDIDRTEAEQSLKSRGKARQPSENQFWDSTEARRTAAKKRSSRP
jgi:hypothetical protein